VGGERSPGLGRSYWTVWCAATVSFVGDGFTIGALPLLALSLTDDARLIAAVDALLMVGWLLLGLLSGVVADRADRLGIMWRADALRTVLTAALTTAVLLDLITMPILLMITLLLGLASPFFDNASSSVVPELVTEPLLEKANSLMQVPMMVATNLIGPPLGALLFTLSHPAPFVVDTLSFAVAAFLVLRLTRRRSARVHERRGAEAGSWRMLRTGVSYLVHHRTLRTLAIAVGMINAVTGGVVAVLVLYTTRTLDLPEQAYGWLIATFALGGLLGSVLTAPLVRVCGAKACTIGSLLAFAAVTILLGAVPRPAVVVPVLVVGGVASVVWNVVTISYRQRVVPAHLLGRVTSAYRMVSFLGMPAGAIAAGLLTHSLGVAPTYLIGGVTLLLAGLVTVPFLRAMPGRVG
jgi:MFS family permease